MINILNKEKCCGCFACEAACPTKAIYKIEDEYGNLFPRVDTSKCIDCGKCNKVCIYEQNISFSNVDQVYAGIVKNRDTHMKSASGGAFSALAESFINRLHGVVYGCTYNSEMMPTHIRVNALGELHRLQGSKYIKSSIQPEVFCCVQNDLKNRVPVLFSGTPCQCAALKQFVGEKNCDLLYTVEVICHGVIEQPYWRDYIQLLQTKHNCTITDFSFRNKDKKRSFTARYTARYTLKNGTVKEKRYYTTPSLSYYYNHFLSGKIFRENCYSCMFAKSVRQSDLTIGDFWGYEGSLPKDKGISAILIQTVKGKKLFDLACELLDVSKSNFESVAKTNEQLKQPFDKNKMDYDVLTEWKMYGAEYMQKQFSQKHWKAFILRKLGVYV
ncbi:MAG: Coenzyme F420 hydrogenase/dehydrogenase, beta subunit C-terminal domain [Clostridia bacterium]|nr:Coenzyme F420 hydrogenase/dehydrogenase, beta subunit C-terminal domain [Clostridia bacterium]